MPTARIDRMQKLDPRRSISALHTYLVVEQDWRRVVRHWRDATGEWHEEDLQGEGTITLPCPEIALTLDHIYEGLTPLTVQEMEANRLRSDHVVSGAANATPRTRYGNRRVDAGLTDRERKRNARGVRRHGQRRRHAEEPARLMR